MGARDTIFGPFENFGISFEGFTDQPGVIPSQGSFTFTPSFRTIPEGAGVSLGQPGPVRVPPEAGVFTNVFSGGATGGAKGTARVFGRDVRGGRASTRGSRPSSGPPGSRPSAGGPSRAGGLGLMMPSESPLEPQSFLTEMEPFLPWRRSGPLSLSSTSLPSIQLLARTIFAEAARQHDIPNVMEAIGWAIRNRVESGRRDFPSRTYEGIIFQTKHGRQYASVGGDLWWEAANPAALVGPSADAYTRALIVAVGVYYGTIPDPLGALHFHSGPPTRDFRERLQKRWITPTNPPRIGPFRFYR